MKYRRILGVSVLLAVTTTAANLPAILDFSPGPLAHRVFIGILRWLSLLLVVAWVYFLGRLAWHARRVRRGTPPRGARDPPARRDGAEPA